VNLELVHQPHLDVLLKQVGAMWNTSLAIVAT